MVTYCVLESEDMPINTVFQILMVGLELTEDNVLQEMRYRQVVTEVIDSTLMLLG